MFEKIIHFAKNTYGGIPKKVWVLAIAMLINRCGGMVLLFMTVYLTQHLHLSIKEAGTIMSLWGIGSFVGAFIGGKLVDKIGFYPILIASIASSGVMLLVLSFVTQFHLLCLCTFLVTATGDAFRPANSKAIMYFSKENEYAQSIALNRLAMNLGFSIAPIIAGLLATHNYQYLFWIDGITCIAAAIYMYSSIGYVAHTKIEVAKENNSLIPEDSPYKDYSYLLFMCMCMLYATCFFQFFTTLPVYIKTVCGVSEKHLGYLYAINGIMVAIVEMFLINYIKNRWSKLNFIQLGILLTTATFLLLTVNTSITILILSFVLITFSEMFAMPFMADISMTRSKKATTGQYLAIYSMAWSVAQIIAPIIGTRIIANYGYTALWYVISGIALFSLFGIKLFAKPLSK